jgi:hypothetical protein
LLVWIVHQAFRSMISFILNILVNDLSLPAL